MAFSDPSASSNALPGNHGSPLTRDNFLAVIGGGDFVRQQVVGGMALPGFDDTLLLPAQSENVDVAPTVMGLLGLAAPRDSRGRYLGNALVRAKLPGAGRPSGRAKVSVDGRCRAALGPRGARFDVQVRRRGGFRTLLRNTRRTRVKIRGSAVRVRLRAAGGATGRFVRRGVTC